MPAPAVLLEIFFPSFENEGWDGEVDAPFQPFFLEVAERPCVEEQRARLDVRLCTSLQLSE